MEISFTVPGKLSGKQRPRFSRKSGRPYTPAKTISQEAVVRSLAQTAMGDAALLEGALALTIRMTVMHPASWSKRKCATTKWVSGKPDCDNIGKLAADSMNGIVYRDDAQIAKLDIERRYGERECTQITVSVLTHAAPCPITYSGSEVSQ
ncbi:MAG: RusA family crossover junction endodeoxyribonuclease [Rhizomicrobium sp.]